jgi:hypothetical protein
MKTILIPDMNPMDGHSDSPPVRFMVVFEESIGF